MTDRKDPHECTGKRQQIEVILQLFRMSKVVDFLSMLCNPRKNQMAHVITETSR